MVFHAAVAPTRWRVPLDFTIHFLGGASIAFFFFHTVDCFKKHFGAVSSFTHYLLSFALACTMGVFWELGEFASDIYLKTRIQQNIPETMADLIADVSGATISLLGVYLVRRMLFRNRTNDDNE